MRITEITLKGASVLQFAGKQIAMLELRECVGRNDCLGIRFDDGPVLELPAAVDVSERLRVPRIFVIEGRPGGRFLIFGGEKAYWVSRDGRVESVLPLFRKYGEEEYWETRILERPDQALIIYEAGVLLLDQDLQAVCHKPKLLNDDFISLEGESLKFVRDHDSEWFMSLACGNGELESRLK